MRERPFLAIGSVRDFEVFKSYLSELNLDLAIDKDLVPNDSSPLAQELNYGSIRIGNRFTIHPMEGWDGTPDGRPSDKTVRRWKMFGRSGAKLIWGGEAVAVTHDGRANPNQLLMTKENLPSLLELRETLVREHIESCGSDKGLFVGLQLTHSGRFSRPNASNRPEPRILYRHPILDRRLNLSSDYPLMTDGEIRSLIENFHRSARMAWEAGYEFVDIKHCHGYLGHEFLSSHTRQGDYGGSFENRTRFLREVVEGIRSLVPELKIAVRLSAFDLVPYRPDPDRSRPGKPGPGVPEAFSEHLPYKFGFGVNINDPTKADLDETYRFLSLLNDLDIRLVNITAGSPYYNPHIQRPALYPPWDGYQPPEDPLAGVARQLNVCREIKQRFPDLLIVGSAFTYLQEFLPNVAQALVREGWVDSVGLGRMVLSYPEMPLDILSGKLQKRRICRTFSDCTTAPRNGLPSGCYPLDSFYKDSKDNEQLKQIKQSRREG